MKKVIIFIVILLFAFGCYFYYNKTTSTEKVSISENKLNIYYIDVGQGDSELIIYPDKRAVLIDAGSDDNYSNLCSFFDSLGITEFDTVIATHPHEDHIGALDEILSKYKTKKIYMPYAKSETKAYKNLLQSIKDNNIEVKKAVSGEVIEKSNDITATILAPNSDNYGELNNYSVVLHLKYKNNSFLFQGDAEKESETEILNKYRNISANIIKVGHHGSSSSSSYNYLKTVKPKYAIISCGVDNDYNHPHKTTLNTLKKLGITPLRTDEIGTIHVVSDGKSYDVYKEEGK